MHRSMSHPDRPAAARGDQLPDLGGRSLAEKRSATLFRVHMMVAGAKLRASRMTAESIGLAAEIIRARRGGRDTSPEQSL